ncbi:MAG: ATP phosphoribosyltransferase [Leptospiraceae bacterium]|nr:ATP phosphoribosyltransferase [Leptospiraceae bacterium]
MPNARPTADRLRIALPKGRMSEESLAFFAARGLCSPAQATDSRQLIVRDEANGIDFYLLRSKDVGAYVEQGAADLGIMGLDLLLEHRFRVFILAALPFGHCRLAVAYPEGKTGWQRLPELRVATKYPRLATEYFFRRGLNIRIIELYGSVEIAPLTGLADVIVDLVSTGATLKANQLVEEETILESTARLILNPSAFALRRQQILQVVDALSGF